ncbi:Low affinity cationic amino acid transporter 2 [Papilio machaon]|uniref:Low affinity cationic amino acid transporter 2 n=1 Tax=Papilio machaon TaxID=76193 RepID=A0A194QL91_PAPMA|nr:Low affinity cationic amino acid transporter 2 [Papilio machaon]
MFYICATFGKQPEEEFYFKEEFQNFRKEILRLLNDFKTSQDKMNKSEPTFADTLSREAGFNSEVWDLLTDLEFVLLYQGDNASRCIELCIGKMTAPEFNDCSNYGSVRNHPGHEYTVRQAYEDGGIKAGAVRAARLAYGILSRRKAAEEGVARLARVLSALDLTALGVGSTLGVGVYVLAGDVAKNYAGPAVILSFLLAAVASVFAGLCYAEFGARVPKAGSAYVYSYVCVGEFMAFIIGWNLILEYIIGAASVVKALSEYLDSLLNKAMSTHLEAVLPLNTPHLAKYPDFFAFAVIMAFSIALAFGVKESTKFNNFCTGVNLCVVLFVIISGSFKGLCYAEFGARVPKAGSAYVYSYVCVGEFMAFIIGWNLILEYIIGAASVVKALSEYLDSLLNKAMSTHLEAVLPLNTPHLAKYPDFFAFAVIMAFSIALAFGVKESTKFNNFCTGVNLCVVLFVIISGSFKADTKNWRIPASEVPKTETKDFGSGGFAPYGLAGIIKGAAVCFYGFIGFDCVATAGEEARRPQKTIPFAVVASLLIVFLAYCGVSSVLTLMMPYYMQDEKAPFPFVYDQLGWPWAKYAVSVGAICALCSSLLGAVFPLPRIIYAMASDGLLFKFMGVVSERFQTPLVGTIIAGLFTGTLAMIFELEQLIHMMSIGTLLAYSMVASCVLLLR